MQLSDLFNEIKAVDGKGNIILPKEYLKKFILMNLLILLEKRRISQKDIFNYLKGNEFEIPGVWDTLNESKQEKTLTIYLELLNLMKKF